jgi:hypothetical protein
MDSFGFPANFFIVTGRFQVGSTMVRSSADLRRRSLKISGQRCRTGFECQASTPDLRSNCRGRADHRRAVCAKAGTVWSCQIRGLRTAGWIELRRTLNWSWKNELDPKLAKRKVATPLQALYNSASWNFDDGVLVRTGWSHARIH